MNKKILLFLFILSFICFTYAEGQKDHVSVKIFNQVYLSYQMGPDDPNPFFKDFRVEGLNPVRAFLAACREELQCREKIDRCE